MTSELSWQRDDAITYFTCSWFAKREIYFAARLFLVGPQSGRKLEQESGRIVKGGTLRAAAPSIFLDKIEGPLLAG